MVSKSRTVTQIKLDETAIESMKRIGEQFSSAALFAAPKTHTFLDYSHEIRDRIKDRGTFDLIIHIGYDNKKKKIEIKDGKVEIKLADGSTKWVDVLTGLPSFKQRIKRAGERETWRNMAIETMENKLAVATIIESSRKASKKAKVKRKKELEKLLGISKGKSKND